MKNPFKKKTMDQLQSEAEGLSKTKDVTEREIVSLDEARGDLILNGSPDEIVAHDAKRLRLSVVLEQTAARLSRLSDERAEAETAAADHARRQNYDKVKSARATGVEALAEYQRHAEKAAEALKKLAQVETAIAGANADLPVGAEPIPMAEPDNSRPAEPAVFGEARRGKLDASGAVLSRGATAPMISPPFPGRRHVSVRHRTRLASVNPNDPMLYDGTYL